MTDFRALCAELTDDLEGWYVCNLIGNDPAEEYTAASKERIHRARAALAEQPVVPTDEELREMWFGSEWFNEGATLREFISIARAVLARWGQQ
jgi:hypothetical protein